MINNKLEFNISKARIDMSNLKVLRNKKNYTQIKLGHCVGISNSSIEAYEEQKRIPSLPIAYRLADTLETSIDFLVGRSNELAKYYSLSQTDKEKVIQLINELSTDKELTKC